ncbi:hypothetical protein GCM10007868_15420 [Gluconobacter frateurii]|uniref:Uncharacterized protein n=1 Tax=Gluconobacter frateurii NRIC 0228 TaxID=1307946 RepID=A0ABQ0QEM6_9PROT|nr:hypothetical protein AA0228_2671 [Gluconobacter frateurii NRIC 0228]GLP90467.1 hypothetical protein GCM10007868_15420 [Gluconobacter frateurii]
MRFPRHGFLARNEDLMAINVSMNDLLIMADCDNSARGLPVQYGVSD